jgi:hypothetical protein
MFEVILAMSGTGRFDVGLVETETFEVESRGPVATCLVVVVSFVKMQSANELRLMIVKSAYPGHEGPENHRIGIYQCQATCRLVSLSPVKNCAGKPQRIAKQLLHLDVSALSDTLDLLASLPLSIDWYPGAHSSGSTSPDVGDLSFR